jgi:hypothetical protein
VQDPPPTYVTVRPSGPTAQTPRELEVTVLTPSPVVITVAVKPKPPKVALVGIFEIVGVVGVSCPTENVCALPEFAA